MKVRNRGSRQSRQQSRTNSQAQRSKRRRQQIRRAATVTAQVGSARQKTNNTSGKLDGNSALNAVRQMGISVDANAKVDTAAARKVAEGAAISAARTLGITIKKADGSIDTEKARAAVSQVLGFSVERDGEAEQGAAAVRSQQAAVSAAQSILTTAQALGIDTNDLGNNLQDAGGNLDAAKATRIAEIALDLKVAKKRQLGRREALDTLDIGLDAATTQNPLTRRAASDAIEKLQSASVIVSGKIDRRQALVASQASSANSSSKAKGGNQP
ncbi:MAG: hypothetical protein AAFQ40_03990 [Cyanobacteria bacterium J06623_5]